MTTEQRTAIEERIREDAKYLAAEWHGRMFEGSWEHIDGGPTVRTALFQHIGTNWPILVSWDDVRALTVLYVKAFAEALP